MQQVKVVNAASAVIGDESGRVVLVQRLTEPDRGRWSVPGGKVEGDETLVQAAAREAFEETGLVVEIGPELWSVVVPYRDDVVYEIHDFAATVLHGTLHAGDDATAVRWVEDHELDQMPLTEGLADLLRANGPMAASSRRHR